MTISGVIVTSRPMETSVIPFTVRTVIASVMPSSFEVNGFDPDRDDLPSRASVMIVLG